MVKKKLNFDKCFLLSAFLMIANLNGTEQLLDAANAEHAQNEAVTTSVNSEIIQNRLQTRANLSLRTNPWDNLAISTYVDATNDVANAYESAESASNQYYYASGVYEGVANAYESASNQYYYASGVYEGVANAYESAESASNQYYYASGVYEGVANAYESASNQYYYPSGSYHYYYVYEFRNSSEMNVQNHRNAQEARQTIRQIRQSVISILMQLETLESLTGGNR